MLGFSQNIYCRTRPCVQPLPSYVFSTDAYVVKEPSIPSFERVSPSKQDGARVSLAVHKFLQMFQTAITKPESAPFPVIVAVHGLVIGLGVDIMCACDVRYAAESSTFSIKVTLLIISGTK